MPKGCWENRKTGARPLEHQPTKINRSMAVEHMRPPDPILGKPAIERVMERYRIKTDKDSGITSNPNHYAEESGQPDYILNLLLSVIAVSVRTVGIVEGLPERMT